MRIRLDQVRREPLRWDVTRRIAAADLGRPELLDLGEVGWSGEITSSPPGFLLRARLSYRQTLACMRCLEPTDQTVHSDVELLVRVAPEPEEGEALLEEEDLGVLFVEDGVVETESILREQLQLNIPMRVVCRPDCRGLCPECGANRNRDECDCGDRAADPRWAALERFRGPRS